MSHRTNEIPKKNIQKLAHKGSYVSGAERQGQINPGSMFRHIFLSGYDIALHLNADLGKLNWILTPE